MLETIREYGLEVLAASGEKEMTQQAHVAYYLALAEEAGQELVGPQQAAWLHRLEREHANLHAALHWSIAQGKVKHDMTGALRLAIARAMNMKRLIASCLEGLVEVGAIQGKFVWAAQLGGAAEVLREAVSLPIPFVDRASYEREVTTVRSQLGEKVFAAAWVQGRTMLLEQVLATQGREVVPPPVTTMTTPSSAYPMGLTAREVEVLRLVAQGLTNGEVAEKLGLSEKTIAHHLTHIFNKTTSENRAGAAAFAIRHGLA